MTAFGTILSTTDIVELKTITKTLTATQIKALNTTPIEVIPAPGSGNIIVPINGILIHNYNTTNFDGAIDYYPAFKSGSTYYKALSEQRPFSVSGRIDPIDTGPILVGYNGKIGAIDITNLPVYIYASADSVNGDGTGEVYIQYMVLTA